MATSRRLDVATAVRMLAITLAVGGLHASYMAAAAQPVGTAPVREPTSSSDEARIRAIVAAQVTAWNAGDARAFSASFAQDGSFTNIRGSVFYGHRAFEDRHVEIFRTFFKGSKLTMVPTRVRFVRPDVAIVDVATELSQLVSTPPGIKPAADGRIRTRLQEVFARNSNEWYIESYHNVDVKEP